MVWRLGVGDVVHRHGGAEQPQPHHLASEGGEVAGAGLILR
jgi:hypothetical protein